MTPAWIRYVRTHEPMAICKWSVVEECYQIHDRHTARGARRIPVVLGRGGMKREAWKAAALSVRARRRAAA